MLNEMRVLDASGDKKTQWDATNPDEVEAARKEFDFLVKEKKYLAYRVKKDGSAGERMKEFDPSAELMILQKQNQGG